MSLNRRRTGETIFFFQIIICKDRRVKLLCTLICPITRGEEPKIKPFKRNDSKKEIENAEYDLERARNSLYEED
ncbi:MAG: hypothetical protein DRN25_07710, partial [Thermoplasmata archaeon]